MVSGVLRCVVACGLLVMVVVLCWAVCCCLVLVVVGGCWLVVGWLLVVAGCWLWGGHTCFCLAFSNPQIAMVVLAGGAEHGWCTSYTRVQVGSPLLNSWISCPSYPSCLCSAYLSCPCPSPSWPAGSSRHYLRGGRTHIGLS